MNENETVYFLSEIENALIRYKETEIAFEEALRIEDPERRYNEVNSVYRRMLPFKMGSPTEKRIGNVLGKKLIKRIEDAFTDSFLAMAMNDFDWE